ncbi:uncharacterized protein LOC142564581 isoform X1 [Dermacentor variabilis]|uniref:uncharacterized protein LOC142564581 isoform X1 n=1 Tax=Dermacentor variabilis TaxID=34621 RepID=UPI003F5C9C94
MSHPSLVFGARMASSKVPYQLIFLVTHPADRRTDQPVLHCTAKLGLLPRGLNCAAGDDICRWKRCADDEVESQACVVPMLILSRCGSGRLAARSHHLVLCTASTCFGQGGSQHHIYISKNLGAQNKHFLCK